MGDVALDGRRKERKVREEEKWMNHYSSSQKILLVGEGDFSFSACLAKNFGSARNMVATSLDSKGTLKTKHWSSAAHLAELKSLGCRVLHDVDATYMNHHPILRRDKFDRIIFNFPHAGHDPEFCERHDPLIERHKQLLEVFFKSSSRMLREGGEVHVAHRKDKPYNRWELETLAKKAGLALIECVEFKKADYPGYHNKRGGGIKSNQKFPLGECFTFKFSLTNKKNASLERESDLSRALSALYL